MIMRTTLIIKFVIVAVAGGLGASACSEQAPVSAGPTVVVTTSILGDIVVGITGGDAEVEVIMPSGADPHEFEPSARQVASIRSADLVIANGLGLEEGLEDVLIDASAGGAVLLEVGPLVDPLALVGSEGFDPHVWLDPMRMVTAVDAIADALTSLDGSSDWQANAASYREQLLELDRWITDRLADIPSGERVLVTGHQSFGYFADRYDFEIVATILPGATTMIEPSAAGFSDVVDLLEASAVPAVLTDMNESQALAEQLTAQVSRTVVVVPLLVGGLGEAGSGAETYLDLMRWDVNAIAEVW